MLTFVRLKNPLIMFKKSCWLAKFYSRRLFSSQKPDVLDWIKQEEMLLEPLQYVNKLPNKQHRMLAPAFNHWLQIPKEKFEDIQEAMSTLGSWAILIDDIQDNSAFRYGAPSAQLVFGLPLTVNAASHAMLIIEKKIKKLAHPLAQEIFWNKLTDFHRGQGSDLYWRDKYIYPSEEAHIDMLIKKNSSIFALPVELMQLFSTNGNDYSDLAMDIGLYFTLVDDYCNLFRPKTLKRLAGAKQLPDDYIICSDITEGKITLPIVHAMQFPDVVEELDHILKQRSSDPKLLDHFVSLLKKHGSDEYVRGMLRTLEDEIRIEIDQLGGNALVTALVDDLSFYE